MASYWLKKEQIKQSSIRIIKEIQKEVVNRGILLSIESKNNGADLL